MISKTTVLVLGAGASAPFGFPSGRKLLLDLSTELEVEASVLFRLLYGLGFEPAKIQSFGQELRDSMQPSVDAFLENRPDLKELGKAAIAASLIRYEQASAIARTERESWYEYLFQSLSGRFEKVARQMLSVITFNYDRSLEYFLFTAFRNSYGLSEKQAWDMVASIPVLHLYGSLGTLQPGTPGHRAFTPNLDGAAVRAAASSIRIIQDGKPSEELKNDSAHYLENAANVCFLGFGYHPTNVRRLGIDEFVPPDAKVYGTCFRMMNAEIDRARRLFEREIEFGSPNHDALMLLRDLPVLG